jgi:hypothetical protein
MDMPTVEDPRNESVLDSEKVYGWALKRLSCYKKLPSRRLRASFTFEVKRNHFINQHNKVNSSLQYGYVCQL